MSLINQVLQDLDTRRASSAERVHLSRHVRALPRNRSHRTAWWIAGLAVVALGVAGAIAWYTSRPRPAPPVPHAPVAEAPATAAPTDVASVQGLHADTRPDPAPQPPEAIPISAIVASVRLPAEPVPPAREADRDRKSQPAPVSAPAPTPRPAEPSVASALAPTPPAPPRPAAAAAAAEKSAVAPAPAHIDKRVQPPSPAQLAESEFRDGTSLLHQGRRDEAQEKYRNALHHTPGHTGAREALFGVLLDAKRPGEAEQVLREGLNVNTAQPRLAMTLARMQVGRGDTAGAIETLHRSASSALGSADYVAFLAALLQRQGRHAEAVDHYQTALSLAAGSAIWSMGLGISLQALNRTHDAREAYRRANAANALSPELQAFVDQRLKQLQ